MPKRKSKARPPLVPLRYAPDGHEPYCELCRRPLKVGEPVAWWPLLRWSGRQRAERPASYCSDCHAVCVRAGRAIEGLPLP
jgi:hypothetical protein